MIIDMVTMTTILMMSRMMFVTREVMKHCMILFVEVIVIVMLRY